MNLKTLASACLVAGAVAAAACCGVLAAPAAAATPGAAGFKDLQWDALVPKDWDPTKRFRDANVGPLNDSDPRVQTMMRDLRAEWDNAPTNSQMDGATGRLPGYIIPLEEAKGQLKEFLLVPYFGACIHTPPPPANQIIHVVLAKPVKGYGMMDAVWVGGTLKTLRKDSPMGMSGYQMQAVSVETYTPR